MTEFIFHLSPYLKFTKTDNKPTKKKAPKLFRGLRQFKICSDFREIMLKISNKRSLENPQMPAN